MTRRYDFENTGHDAPVGGIRPRRSPEPARRYLFDANWEHPSADAMLLYVADEPRIGYEFSYFGLRWEIVDYREGWVAKLLVD